MLSQGPGIRYALALLRAGRIKRLTEMLNGSPRCTRGQDKMLVGNGCEEQFPWKMMHGNVCMLSAPDAYRFVFQKEKHLGGEQHETCAGG